MIRAFLSFAHEDLNLVNLFRAQAKNEASDIEFADYSLKQPFDSKNADYIGRGITEKIQYSQVTVCLYGPKTYQSQWVNWELLKSLQLGKPIMGVYLYDNGSIQYYPGPLKDWPRVSWNSFDVMSTMRRLVEGSRFR